VCSSDLVANMSTSPSGSGGVADFNICITHTPPANDECTGAISLTSNAACSNTSGTLVGASPSTITNIGYGVANKKIGCYDNYVEKNRIKR